MTHPVQHVIHHVKASYPCTMNSVVNWCVSQGLEESFCPAITTLLTDGQITLSIEDDEGGERVLIIDPT